MSDSSGDLKLIDDLLLAYMHELKLRPEDLEGPKGTNLTERATKRLRQAWRNGEIGAITVTWDDFFKEADEPRLQR